MTRRQGYTVGITIYVGKDGELGLYENGLRQNVVFLWQLFDAAPGCARALLLNHGDGEFTGWPAGLGMERAEVVRTSDEVLDTLDNLIVLGAAVEPDLLRRARERGVRVIGYKGGNAAIISIEAMVAKPPRPDAERYFDAGCYDALWLTPQHMPTYAGWARTVYRAPVHQVPQIWAPTFIDNRRADLGDRFGYRPDEDGVTRPWRVGIMEPNITVMKTSHLPMLVCEAAYRHRPDMFQAAYVTNALQLSDVPHFVSFSNALSIVKSGRMTFEPRFVSADFLANHADAIVVHQWENALNYLYYEVLHGGYPLIHNSHLLRDVGYYYPDFAADIGGQVLVEAWQRHDAELESYRKKVAGLTARLAPTSPANIELHERLLAA